MIEGIYRNTVSGVEGHFVKLQNGVMHIKTPSGEIYYGPAQEFILIKAI